jgi:hypothetical protein
MHAMFRIAVAALIALAGCGSKPQPASTTPMTPPDTSGDTSGNPAEGDPATSEETVELAPPPFTAEQIRDATKVGRTYRFAMRQGEQTATVTMRFTAVSPERATIERTVVDAGGQTVDQGTDEASWGDLVDHASYPASQTEITQTTVEVPAGKFDAVLYTITAEQEGKAFVSRMYFAKSLPGAPVKAEITLGDQSLLSMEMLEHTPGQ